MKKLTSILVLISCAFLLAAMQCEKDPLNQKLIAVDNLISIETKDNYYLNDSIIINSNFSRFLPETGYSNLLDIYITSNSYEFYFDIQMDKKLSNGSWEFVNLTNIVVLKRGSFESYKGCSSILNTSNNIYELRAAIPLLDSGEYRIRISETLEHYSIDSKVVLKLVTNIPELNENQYYIFTVN